MPLIAGADFGTLSVRVTIMDTDSGQTRGSAIAPYPLKRDPADPLLAQQSHDDHMTALVKATREAIAAAAIDGSDVAAFAADTTGSSVVIVDENLVPLDDYYLWADHRGHREADEITALARAENLEALKWCGGTYSHEWGYAKLLHFLRHNPDKRDRVATALEHCDMVAATLCGITEVAQLPRSVCAMGHKWMWGAAWGGYPPQDFLERVDPLLAGINAKLEGRMGTALDIAGTLSPLWAERLGLRAGIPIPFGAFDAHWDAIGSGGKLDDIVNVVGTSTCFIAIGPTDTHLVPGICGAVPDSVVPGATGVEAGQSATGDIFEAIAKRAGTDVTSLVGGLEHRGPGETGLLRLTWDNGDRTVLVRSDLGGVTLGWDLGHTAADEMHAAIEGMAMHTRIILERMRSCGVGTGRVINGGGIPQKNDVLNQIYADVLGEDVYVPTTSPTGVGSCIFAALACGAFADVQEAQARLSPPLKIFHPRPEARAAYEELFALFRELYFGFGAGEAVDLSTVLPRLRAFRLKASDASVTKTSTPSSP
ncbi:ribulokinase [Tianweitania sp. BSSL-BM11]|uniref:Ribulokinase n=1 Tax=Tianweitania aestuarii TaxID=2814886 RepID=A0ABS5RWG1_9HYPH|nr:ribulokinase [Tianweitania aestuarii]MBS9721361.1 ribulokinase [Tianweitania aestuarii]